MIYVQENKFSRQIDLFNYLTSQDSYSICAWLYPESEASSIASQSITQSDLEPVTTYEDGTLPKHTKLVPCSEKTLKIYLSSQIEITENCDSLALYQANKLSWCAVTIGHEGICLVRDETLLQQLIAEGFKASIEAPDWW